MERVGKNVVIATALIAAGFLAAWLRFRPFLTGGEYTDGVATYATEDAGTVRYAVWDRPRPLAGGVNQSSRESRPALSADGRWLVFEVGERGLNCDLWIAEMVGGEPREARRLAGLDGPADECAPAFRGDELYFASDRAPGAGGLDLWRARFHDGRVREPERLGGAANSPADDTDPAPRPGSDGLVFASNRGGAGYGLFEARPDAAGAWQVQPIAALDSRADEREPSFTADGRTLFFASDRAGDFDLFRASPLGEGWSEPAPLAGLNTPAAERAPFAAFDDFSLYFARDTPDGGLDLVRARSLELFRSAAEPVGWLELAILASLLLAALLAWLAKRWPGLETLYKCYLISLAAHLLLLWLFGGLFVDSSDWKRSGREARLHVRLERAPPSPRADRRERAGELEPAARAEQAPVEVVRRAPAAPNTPDAPDAPRAAIALAAPAPAALPRPGRAAAEVAPGPAPALALQAPNDAPARRAGSPSALALDAAATDAPRAAVIPASVGAPVSGGARPVAVEAARPAPPARLRGPARPDAPRPERAQLARSASAASTAVGVELAVPPADLAKRSGALAPGLELDELAASHAERAARGAAPRLAVRSTPAQGDERPDATARLEIPNRPAAIDAPAILRSEAAPPPRATAELELWAGAPSERDRPRVVSTAGADLLADLAPLALTSRARDARSSEPARPALLAEAEPAQAPAPAALETVVLEAPPRPAEVPASPKRDLDDTPFRNRAGAERARALELYGGSRETEAAVARGLAYLARVQHPGGNWGDRRARDEKYGAIAIGKTGLALLAFLGAGHTHSSATEHSEVVARALAFLLGAQDSATGHFGRSEAYGHGIATYALSECYALTGDASLRDPLARAVRQILEHQDHRRDPRLFGGWSYFYPDGSVYDRWPRTAITVWQVMALESARLAGLEVPRAAFDAARTFLENARDPRADWYRYNHDPERLGSGWPTLPASTPAALFALALFGEDLAAEPYAEPRRFVLERAPREYRRGSDDDFVLRAQGNLYFWYYGTLAMFRAGGESWKRWNAALKDTLLDGQSADGSWRPIDVYAEYARDDDQDRSYSTAMCVLSLEVYYRYYLPLLRVR